MKTNLKFLLIAMLLLRFSAALGQAPVVIPGMPLDSRTIHVQAKVEELFERREYARAHFIYRNELAVIGDKYAQYMVGFMYMTGKGVQKDAITASAWYRLAAERQAPEFTAVRDRLLSAFDAVDAERSDQEYLDLRRQYSDLALMLEVVRKNLLLLNETMTGSRLPDRNTPVIIYDPRRGSVLSSDSYFRQIKSQLQARVDFITDRLDIERLDADLSADEFEALRQQVLQYLQTVNDR